MMASGEVCVDTQSSAPSRTVSGESTESTPEMPTNTDITDNKTNGDSSRQSPRPKSPGKVLRRKNTPLMLPTIAKINAKDKFTENDLIEDDEDAALEEEKRKKEQHAIFLANQKQVISSVRVVVSCEGQGQETILNNDQNGT